MRNVPGAVRAEAICASRLLNIAARSLIGSAWFAFCVPAYGSELIAPGIQPKVEAGAGQTGTRGSSSLFHNPANIVYSRPVEPYFDISYASVSYIYTHPDAKFDPVRVNVIAPPVTLGIAMKPMRRFAFGLAAVPLGDGTPQKIERVPLRLPLGGDDRTLPLNVETSQKAWEIAAGGAWRFDEVFTLGLGLVHSRETTRLRVTDPRDETTPTLDAQYGGAFNQYVLGARSELVDRRLVLGGSYRTPVVKRFNGDYATASSPGSFEPWRGADYAPAELSLAGEYRVRRTTIFGEYARTFWSGGRDEVGRGLPDEAEEADLRDTNTVIVGGRYAVLPRQLLLGAIGLYGANVGDGTPLPLSGADATGGTGESGDAAATLPSGKGQVSGVQFGNLDALPRRVISGGWRLGVPEHGYVTGGVQYATGTRSVPEGRSGEGTYGLRVVLLSVGGAWGF